MYTNQAQQSQKSSVDAELEALLAAHNAEQDEPLWPSTVQAAVLIEPFFDDFGSRPCDYSVILLLSRIIGVFKFLADAVLVFDADVGVVHLHNDGSEPWFPGEI